MKTRLTIDRFEGDGKHVAVLMTEDDQNINFPRSLLPPDAKAGDVLLMALERDPSATRKVAEATRKVQDELKGRDPGGDLKL